MQLQGTIRRDKTHVELRTNKDKKDDLAADRRKDGQGMDRSGGFQRRGAARSCFACQPGSFVKITNIKVVPWDGKFEDSSGKEESTPDDTVKLANQDKVTGQLKEIRDGKVKFASSYAELNIPLERIQEMDFASAKAEQPKPAAGAVRVVLPDDGSLTLDTLSWNAKACTGASANFGKASFSPGAFTRILFNLTNQPSGDDSDDMPADSAGQEQTDQ